MTVADCLTILAISLGSGFLSEGISWLIIYRTDSYKRQKDSIEKMAKQLEKEQDKAKSTPIDKRGPVERKAKQTEDSLKVAQQQMAMTKMKTMVFHIVIFMSVLSMLSSMYDGLIVAELPFTPFSFIQKMSQRGLPDDTHDTACSMFFIYMISSFGLRASVQKALGFSPPKGAPTPSLFAPPPQS